MVGICRAAVCRPFKRLGPAPLGTGRWRKRKRSPGSPTRRPTRRLATGPVSGTAGASSSSSWEGASSWARRCWRRARDGRRATAKLRQLRLQHRLARDRGVRILGAAAHLRARTEARRTPGVRTPPNFSGTRKNISISKFQAYLKHVLCQIFSI